MVKKNNFMINHHTFSHKNSKIYLKFDTIFNLFLKISEKYLNHHHTKDYLINLIQINFFKSFKLLTFFILFFLKSSFDKFIKYCKESIV